MTAPLDLHQTQLPKEAPIACIWGTCFFLAWALFDRGLGRLLSAQKKGNEKWACDTPGDRHPTFLQLHDTITITTIRMIGLKLWVNTFINCKEDIHRSR